jgi:predicted HD phosphohydrolase
VKCKVTVREHSWYTVEGAGHYEKYKVIVCSCGERYYKYYNSDDVPQQSFDDFSQHSIATHRKHPYSIETLRRWVVDEPYDECLYCSKIKES